MLSYILSCAFLCIFVFVSASDQSGKPGKVKLHHMRRYPRDVFQIKVQDIFGNNYIEHYNIDGKMIARVSSLGGGVYAEENARKKLVRDYEKYILKK